MTGRFRDVLAITLSVLMVTSLAGAAVASTTGSTDRVSPLAQSSVGWTDSLTDRAVQHSVRGTPTPSWFVSVEDSSDLSSLEQWADSSNQREVVERYNASNTYLVAIPTDDIQGWSLGGERKLDDLGYVTGWDINIQMGYVEPVTGLQDEQQLEPPGATWARLTTSGEYDPSVMAWDGDANQTHVSNVHKWVGADNPSWTGDGVNVAVIDSGVHFANGSQFGDGTPGSDIRVADAHDYVENESVDLSVDRANLSTELNKVGDPVGHGTWVASTVAHADSGIAPEANLHAYRVLNSEGQGSTADIRQAVARADREDADILVMSLGSPVYSDALASELKRVLGPDGNVTAAFVAVGNSYPMRVSSPADVDAVIGVQATNPTNASAAEKAYFGNGGPDNGLDMSGGRTRGVTPDTSAPGMKLSAPVLTSETDKTPINVTKSGTSMAAPVAAGVGALVLEQKPGLHDEPDEFHRVIVRSGAHTPNIGVTESSGGMVNATRAIKGYDVAAPNRDLPAETDGRDAANRALAGDVGRRLVYAREVLFS